MVRARRRRHLECLQEAFSALAAYPVIETRSGDYRWRVVAPKQVVASVVSDLIAATDYKNFKSACATREDVLGPGYSAALHSIWSVLARLQDE